MQSDVVDQFGNTTYSADCSEKGTLLKCTGALLTHRQRGNSIAPPVLLHAEAWGAWHLRGRVQGHLLPDGAPQAQHVAVRLRAGGAYPIAHESSGGRTAIEWVPLSASATDSGVENMHMAAAIIKKVHGLCT